MREYVLSLFSNVCLFYLVIVISRRSINTFDNTNSIKHTVCFEHTWLCFFSLPLWSIACICVTKVPVKGNALLIIDPGYEKSQPMRKMYYMWSFPSNNCLRPFQRAHYLNKKYWKPTLVLWSISLLLVSCIINVTWLLILWCLYWE